MSSHSVPRVQSEPGVLALMTRPQLGAVWGWRLQRFCHDSPLVSGWAGCPVDLHVDSLSPCCEPSGQVGSTLEGCACSPRPLLPTHGLSVVRSVPQTPSMLPLYCVSQLGGFRPSAFGFPLPKMLSTLWLWPRKVGRRHTCLTDQLLLPQPPFSFPRFPDWRGSFLSLQLSGSSWGGLCHPCPWGKHRMVVRENVYMKKNEKHLSIIVSYYLSYILFQ